MAGLQCSKHKTSFPKDEAYEKHLSSFQNGSFVHFLPYLVRDKNIDRKNYYKDMVEGCNAFVVEENISFLVCITLTFMLSLIYLFLNN